MRLRAQIIVEIVANDYIEAAEHQKSIGQFLEKLKEKYPDASLVMRERRERNKPELAAQAPTRFLSIAKADPK